MWVRSLGWEDPLEEGTRTYSSILTWRIPWTEEPGRLQSIGLQRDWSKLTHMHASGKTHKRRKIWEKRKNVGEKGKFPGNREQQFSSVQLLSHVWLFATPWTAARQVSLSIANSQSLLKLVSIMLVMPSNHLIICCPLLLLTSIFPSIKVFSNEFFASGCWTTGVSASASVLPMNIQDWFPLGSTDWISL